MKELMAFVVLSLPILAVLLILVLAVLAARAAIRRKKVPAKKWKAGILAAFAVILVFTWDEISGRLYFHYLCTTEGGAKVYKQVKLPPEYWNPDGSPVFFDARGNRIRSKLDEQYQFRSGSNEQFSKIFRIRQYSYTVANRDTNELLGTYTLFSFFGGWLENYTSLNVNGVGCRNERNFYARFLHELFIPEQNKTTRR